MRLTLIHPCIGRRVGEPYIRTWQMEPLPSAVLAGLTPPDIDIRFYDDRMELIPYAEPTDLVALSVETYTARRAYQIASTYRQRGVPVVMGGFHPTLVPEEAAEYAEALVLGEAETLWPQVLDDFRAGRLQKVYRCAARPALQGLRPNRAIFAGKRYLPVALVETGRGCRFQCEFCSVQTYFHHTYTRRPLGEVLEEIRALRRRLLFFVDDNIIADREAAKEFCRALIPLRVQWMSQADIQVAQDEELLRLLRASGCQGLLIGFESLNAANLKQMGKSVNLAAGDYAAALAQLRRYGLRLYATFLMGYDDDGVDTFQRTLDFALRHRFYIAAFNHVTPFPGTPLYARLEREGRLLYDRWWLNPDYRYGAVPFAPRGLTAEQVRDQCVQARARFYDLPSILKRGLDFQVNSHSLPMLTYFFAINLLMRAEVRQRRDFPLGDEGWRGELLKAG